LTDFVATGKWAELNAEALKGTEETRGKAEENGETKGQDVR
jgi:hypothetical protein